MSRPTENTPLLGEGSGTSDLADKFTPRTFKKQRRCFHISFALGIILLVLAAATATILFFFYNQEENSSPVKSTDEDGNKNRLLETNIPLTDLKLPFISLFTLPSTELLQKAVDVGKEKLAQKQASNVESVATDSPSFKHQHSIASTDAGNTQSGYGYVENEASKYLRNKGVVGVIEYSQIKTLRWTNESGCFLVAESVTCISSRYRTDDSFCNNLINPTWGIAMKPFRRALPANYSDGISAPRGGFNTSLPSARDVSTRVHRPAYREDSNFTVMLAIWGQFIDHDMTATALSRGPNGETISCCLSTNTAPECFPVNLSPDDEYYSSKNLTCMEFIRSAAALRCSFGPREQLNQVSSFLDGSMIYGSSPSLSQQLRSHENGTLLMSNTKDGRALLPLSTDSADGCNQEDELKKGRYCFLSGDSRANENTHLTSIHLIFARQHNKVAQQLVKLNPDWNDETVYQEARHIVAAQLQHITYNEFLPSILGVDMMNKLKLNSNRENYSTAYNASIDPTISNNFATASFRFAHTLIPRMMKILANDTDSPEYVQMHKMLFNPYGIHEGNLDSIMRGALQTHIEKADNYFSKELTEHLFEADEKNNSHLTAVGTNKTVKSPGLDLVALNIQRGRDHGLPAYPHWRNYCNLSEVKSFDDLQPIFDEESLNIIRKMYKSVDDMDLYTGALSEKPITGGLVGATLTCLIGDQFYRLKYGDRYWYETNEKPQAFTPEQLGEIRKTSLASIICENSDNLTTITPHVMRVTGDDNQRVPCSDIPQPDLSYWNESTTETNRSTTNSLNKNPWSWRKHANPVWNEYLIEDSITSRSRNLWNEYLVENDTYFGEPSLPPWTIEWAKNHSLSLASEIAKEVSHLGHLPNISSSYIQIPQTDTCNITFQTRKIEILRSNKETIAPRSHIPVKTFELKLLVWSPNASDSLDKGFQIIGEAGRITLDSLRPNSTCITPQRECVYYSKVILGDKIDDSNLFEVTEQNHADQCSVIAPILLQGHYLDVDTFYWTGKVTIVAYTPKSKEEQMSLHTYKDTLTFTKIKGSLSIREQGLWNGSLPAVFDTSLLSWYVTSDTVVYPVSWSGFYEEDRLDGVFLLPQKFNDTAIRWHDGSFSINLPQPVPDRFRDMIHTNRVYCSVVYFTSKPDAINRFDVTVFNELKDWVFTDYSQIVLTGRFDKDGRFSWSGDISIRMGPLAVELPSTTYRPYGKYLFKIHEAELFAQLKDTGPVQKWWSGQLTPDVVLPRGRYDERLYANIYDLYLIWDYNNYTVTDGNATFVTYNSPDEMKIWGTFEFDFAYLMADVWTSTLNHEVTYFSPVLLQYDRMTFDFGDDMPERLIPLERPDLGVLAPITLLGKFDNTNFIWKGDCLITVVDV